MTKMAWDTKMGDRAFHLEAGGVITSAKVTAIPGGTTTFDWPLQLWHAPAWAA